MNSEEDNSPVLTQKRNIIPVEMADTFSIVADYKDPFLGRKLYTPSDQNNAPKKIEKTKPEKKTEKVQKIVRWPQLQYQGLVSSNDANLAFLQVGTKSHLVKKGDIVDMINIVSFNADSITVKYEDETKSIYKQ